MLRIQRALLVELLVMFVLITVVVTSAVFLGVTLRFMRGGGGALGTQLMVQLLPNLLPLALSYSVPFSWLAATALVLGRWVSDHEIVALKASGLHLRVIILPVFAMSMLLGVWGMYYNSFVVPIANRQIRAGLKDFLPQFLESLRGTERTVAFTSGRISFERWDPQRHAFLGAELDRRNHQGHLEEKGLIQELGIERIDGEGQQEGLKFDVKKAYILTVQDGEALIASGANAPFVMGRVEHVGASTLFNDFFGAARFRYRPLDMSMPELMYGHERGGVARGSVKEMRIAINGRLALGSAAFFLGMFSLAVMMVVPASNRRVRDFMLCFLPSILIFFPLQIAGSSMARSTPMPPWLAMWSPNIVLFALTLVLLWRALRR